MAEVIMAEQLQVGDVFYDTRKLGVSNHHASIAQRLRPPLRRVTETRVLNIGAGRYRRISYVLLDSIATGQMDARIELVVARVQPISSDEAIMKLVEMVESEWLTFFHAEGRLWV